MRVKDYDEGYEDGYKNGKDDANDFSGVVSPMDKFADDYSGVLSPMGNFAEAAKEFHNHNKEKWVNPNKK